MIRDSQCRTAPSLRQPEISSITISGKDRDHKLHRLEPGEHQIPFDGRDDQGWKLAAGGYILKLQTDVVLAGGKLVV